MGIEVGIETEVVVTEEEIVMEETVDVGLEVVQEAGGQEAVPEAGAKDPVVGRIGTEDAKRETVEGTRGREEEGGIDHGASQGPVGREAEKEADVTLHQVSYLSFLWRFII